MFLWIGWKRRIRAETGDGVPSEGRDVYGKNWDLFRTGSGGKTSVPEASKPIRLAWIDRRTERICILTNLHDLNIGTLKRNTKLSAHGWRFPEASSPFAPGYPTAGACSASTIRPRDGGR